MKIEDGLELLTALLIMVSVCLLFNSFITWVYSFHGVPVEDNIVFYESFDTNNCCDCSVVKESSACFWIGDKNVCVVGTEYDVYVNTGLILSSSEINNIRDNDDFLNVMTITINMFNEVINEYLLGEDCSYPLSKECIDVLYNNGTPNPYSRWRVNEE